MIDRISNCTRDHHNELRLTPTWLRATNTRLRHRNASSFLHIQNSLTAYPFNCDIIKIELPLCISLSPYIYIYMYVYTHVHTYTRNNHDFVMRCWHTSCEIPRNTNRTAMSYVAYELVRMRYLRDIIKMPLHHNEHATTYSMATTHPYVCVAMGH